MIRSGHFPQRAQHASRELMISLKEISVGTDQANGKRRLLGRRVALPMANTAPKDAINAERILEQFQREVKQMLDAGDSAGIYNAAVRFAQEHGVSFASLTPVLERLTRNGQMNTECLGLWWRDGRTALGANCDTADLALAVGVSSYAPTIEDEDWRYRKAIKVLSPWLPRINEEFHAGTLGPSILGFDDLDSRVLGTYHMGRDGVGLRWRITLNARHLDRPFARILSVLGHESVHQWENQMGRKQGGAYHTKLFREKASEMGIPTDEGGRDHGIDANGRFARFLGRFGILVDTPPPQDLANIGRRKGGSSLAKWVCECRSPVLRVARGSSIDATCQRCGAQFRKVV